MTLALNKVKCFSIKEFLRWTKIEYKELVNSGNNVCTHFMILGRYFDGSRGRLVTISDSWATEFVEKLKPVIDNSLVGN